MIKCSGENETLRGSTLCGEENETSARKYTLRRRNRNIGWEGGGEEDGEAVVTQSPFSRWMVL